MARRGSSRRGWGALVLSGCVAIVALSSSRSAFVPSPQPAAAQAQGLRRRLLGGALAFGATAPGLVQPEPAAAEDGLAKLFLAWTKISEGKNPLEALNSGARRRLRFISKDLDALQKDVFGKDYAAVLTYPKPLREYVPLFTEYTDNIFPGDSAAGRASRVAMRYEVGKFFSSLDRLTNSAKAENEDEMQRAFADMSLAFDRYVKAGDLYAGADPIVSTDIFYKGTPDELLYNSPVTDPPQIKDKIMVITGPDKGRTGLMIGKELAKVEETERPLNAFIKFDGGIGEGEDKLQEIKLVPYGYVAKQKA